MKPFFQAGLLVQDLDAGMAELTTALGLRFGEPKVRETAYGPMRVVFSLDGPPYVELIEGPPGSPWETTRGSRLDHIGLWTDDLGADRVRLLEQGMTIEIDGEEIAGRPYAYFRAPSTGLRIELLERSMEDGFYARWGMDDPRH
jgi:catechol 2,3-dioxygenase-like lactoylglutathione lyase family enzyme